MVKIIKFKENMVNSYLKKWDKKLWFSHFNIFNNDLFDVYYCKYVLKL